VAVQALAGSRVRERRLALGIGQAELARAAGISASYLNLIEHNRRRIGDGLLATLARALGVPQDVLAEGPEGARLDGLRAAAAAAPPTARPEVERAEDLAARFPGWADLIAAQEARIGRLERLVAALNDRIGQDPHLSAALHEVLSAATSVRATAAILSETEDIAPDWRARFHRNLDADSARLARGAEALVAYLDAAEGSEDRGTAAPAEEVEAWLAGLGWALPGLAEGPGAALALAEGLASGAARTLARAVVAQAAADHRALPDDRLDAALAEAGDDPLRLAGLTGATVPAVMRRLALRPGAPEGLIVCDAAGAFLLRKPVAGFPMPRAGAACALWPLYTALARPGQPVEALAEPPGPVPRRFRLRAWGVLHHAGGFAGIEVREALMLIAPEPAPPPAGSRILLVGSTCRICPRETCPARREPSIIDALALAGAEERGGRL
jgi:hypothetical protein